MRIFAKLTRLKYYNLIYHISLTFFSCTLPFPFALLLFLTGETTGERIIITIIPINIIINL